MTFIRVRDKATKHEYDIDERNFDAELHTRVNAPKQYPDLTGPGARPRPVKLAGTPDVTDEDPPKAGQPADKKES